MRVAPPRYSRQALMQSRSHVRMNLAAVLVMTGDRDGYFRQITANW